MSAPVAANERLGAGAVRPANWLVLLCLVLAVAITLDVAAGGVLTHLDHRVGDRMADWNLRGTTWPKALLTVLLYFGQRGVVLSGSVILLGWLSWRQRTVEPALRLGLAVVTIVMVIYACKLGLGRNSPRGDELGEPAGTGASYPSGHVTNAVVLWGLADWSLHRWAGPEWLRRSVRIGRWVAPFAVTLGMTLLNYHWLSDFLGGAAMGVVLLAVVLLPVWAALADRIDARLGLRSSAAR